MFVGMLMFLAAKFEEQPNNVPTLYQLACQNDGLHSKARLIEAEKLVCIAPSDSPLCLRMLGPDAAVLMLVAVAQRARVERTVCHYAAFQPVLHQRRNSLRG